MEIENNVPVSILGISVSKMPLLTRYLEGEIEPDLSGGELSIVYSDGSTKTIPMVDDMESWIKDDKVYIKCLGKTAKFHIYVVRSTLKQESQKNIEISDISQSDRALYSQKHTQENTATYSLLASQKQPMANPVITNGDYKYLNAQWITKPFYSSTSSIRFVADKELEEIYEDSD